MTALSAAMLLFLAVPTEGGADLSRSPLAAEPPSAREVLEQALAQFDKAVAHPDPKGAEATALYREALAGFQSVADAGHRNGHLYYNIANAHFRLGELGKAILNYRRAENLIPGDTDVRRNLSFARSLCEVRIDPKPTTALLRTILFWHYESSPGARTAVALTAYGAFWMLLFVLLLTRRRNAATAALAVALGVVWLACGISVAVETSPNMTEREGVVIAHEATLRKGNGEAYEPQLDRPLTEGIEFRILETRQGGAGNVWHHIELADGKDGWVKDDQIEPI